MKVIHKMLATLLTFCLTVSSVPMAQAEDMKAEVPLELKSTNVKESAEESDGAVDEKIEIQIDSENLNGQSYMQASTGQMELEPSSQKIFSSASQLQLVNYIYMSSVYSGCFGNQLSGLELELYNLYVYLYAEQKSTNSYTHTLEDPIYFTPEIIDNVLIDNESLEMALTTVSEALQTAQDAFAFDYPEVFWFSTTRAEICYIFSYSEGMITSVTLYSPVEIYSGASSNITTYENAVAKATAVIKSRVGNTSKRYYAVKAIHDYVCNNAYYGSTSQARAYSSDGFFLGDGGIVCQGYAYTIKVLCDQLNIPCVCVGGYGSTNGSTASHMWNYIQMEDGKWYMLDATWDDQSSDTDINYT
ncbi:MAG: hypothetical protein LUH52_07635, partial [Bacteroides uniformis]|nr:hypothetical protein [Bacteroides uniformis]